MWSCLRKMNFPQHQHQQCRITTCSAPTTTPNSQPHHHKWLQVKGPNDNKHRLGPKSKLPNVVFYVLLTVLHRFATIDIAHPCSVPKSSILISSVLMLSVPTRLCPRHPHEPLLAGGQGVQLLRGNNHPQPVLYPPPWFPADSDGLRPECWNSIWNLPEWSESIIPPDSDRIQVEFHSNRFQVHSAGFQGPFQQIPSSFCWIPTHSNPFRGPFQPIPTHSSPFHGPFQHIPTHSMGHSNTFQVEFYSNGFPVPSKCHVT